MDKRWFIPIAMILVVAGILLILPTDHTRVCFEDYCIRAQIRDDAKERALGLMYRESLEEGEGMLFVFERAGRHSFWMKNMKIPIDMVFLDSEKRIVAIHKEVPPCTETPCDTYSSNYPSMYVVEVASGFSDRHGLEEGQLVRFS